MVFLDGRRLGASWHVYDSTTLGQIYDKQKSRFHVFYLDKIGDVKVPSSMTRSYRWSRVIGGKFEKFDGTVCLFAEKLENCSRPQNHVGQRFTTPLANKMVYSILFYTYSLLASSHHNTQTILLLSTRVQSSLLKTTTATSCS